MVSPTLTKLVLRSIVKSQWVYVHSVERSVV